ncbi:MAG: hypothetical protein JXR12_15215 [Neptunomonas phycophila]|uniref:hypothetical protein n=1 Tax=Neptunomonas phycophila TaxID=1572645 RepID=UPI003B8B72D0
MSQTRKNANETAEERQERLFKESVANHATRSEKTAWARKQANLQKFVKLKVNPIEEHIRDTQATLVPLYDEVNGMREEMVSSCIHPFDMLVVDGDYCICRFCNKKLAKPIVMDEE